MTMNQLSPIDAFQRYRIPECCAYLRMGRAKLYQQIKAGKIKVIKDGFSTYIPGSELLRKSTLSESLP